jgi:hypothetical protein
VHRLRLIITALALLAWLPATGHCLIAATLPVPDVCCDHADDSAPAAPADCDQCLTLESGNPAPALAPVAPFPAFAEDAWLISLLREHLAAAALSPVFAPPDGRDLGPPRWMFVARTAVPVRGPSLPV